MCYSEKENAAIIKRSNFLRNAGAYIEAVRIEDCGNDSVIYWNKETHTPKIVPKFCHSKFCPICGPKINAELKKNINKLIQEVKPKRLRFLTLTQVDYPKESLELAAIRFRTAFQKLRQCKMWKACIKGFYIKYETTYNLSRKSWHFHAHLLTYGNFINRDNLKTEWMKRSPGAFIIDIKKINKSTSHELSKYCTKATQRGYIPWGELTAYMRTHRMHASSGFLRPYLTHVELPVQSKKWEFLGSVQFFSTTLEHMKKDEDTISICIACIRAGPAYPLRAGMEWQNIVGYLLEHFPQIIDFQGQIQIQEYTSWGNNDNSLL